MTEAIGRSVSDFFLDSYRGLYVQYQKRLGLRSPNMVFDQE